jgi:hypothetical protein
MDEPRNPEGAGPDRRDFVVVPHRPGPLISLDTERSQRGRDDLDELIDDLFPEVEERPGWFDAALVVVGAGLLAWAWIGTVPAIVPVLGAVALGLGCILPARAAWRRARQRQEHRRREGLLEKGVPIDVSAPGAARLVGAYEDLIGLANRSGPELGTPAISAAHGALLEVASLLKGRAPTSERELGYIDRRAAAVAELVGALRELPLSRSEPSGDDLSGVHPDALIEARDELDKVAPFNSVSQLEELIAEARIQRRGRS